MKTIYLNGENVEIQLLPNLTAESREHEAKPDICAELFETKRSSFAKDVTRIQASIFFRAKADTTQVQTLEQRRGAILPRSRVFHSLETADYAVRIATEIWLNVDFCRAALLAHDAGHIIYAHAGGIGLDQALRKIGRGPFDHELQGLRVVEHLECFSPEYRGLNLTYLVRQFLRNRANRSHLVTGAVELKNFPAGFLTLEEQICEIADKLYVVHDIEDMLNAKIFKMKDLAKMCIPILSEVCRMAIKNHFDSPREIAKKIFNILIESLYSFIKHIHLQDFIREYSPDGSFIMTNPRIIKYSLQTQIDFDNLIKWMYHNVYVGNPIADYHQGRMITTVRTLFEYLFANGKSQLQVKRISRLNNRLIDLYKKPENILTDPVQAIIDIMSMIGESYADWYIKQFIRKKLIF